MLCEDTQLQPNISEMKTVTRRVVFYYSHIMGEGGIPPLIRNILRELKSRYSNFDITASDLENVYNVEKNEDLKQEIEFNKVEMQSQQIRPDIAVFLPWPIGWKTFKLAWKLRQAGSTIVLWPWGQLCEKQASANWSKGSMPLLVKWAAIRLLRLFWLQIAHFFFVFSEAEQKDSRLPNSKCVKVIMGGLQNALSEACAENFSVRKDGQQRKVKSIMYFGRGMWKEKGIDQIVKLASLKDAGEFEWHFFISSYDDEFKNHANQVTQNNIHWHFDVQGAELLPWLQSSSAVITLSTNPIPLRALYEAIYAGVPVLTCKETSMDAVKNWLRKQNLGDAIQMINVSQGLELNGVISSMEKVDREALSAAAQSLFNSQTFADWLAEWLEKPSGNYSYFDYV